MKPEPSQAELIGPVHFVLVGTTHAGNIGAAARAMKTMGFASLRLVDPCRYLTQEAHVRASGAGEILLNASVFSSLSDALSDCTSVFGTSARSRTLEGGVLSAREAAASMAVAASVAGAGGVAMVFGRERSGLSNEELALCDRRLCIPCNPDFSSLNLGSAVQVVAYELRQAMLTRSHEKLPSAAGSADTGLSTPTTLGDETVRKAVEKTADNESLELFFEHLEQVLTELQFLDPDNPKLLMPRLRRYFIRNRPDRSELNILRGILSAAHKSAQRPES